MLVDESPCATLFEVNLELSDALAITDAPGWLHRNYLRTLVKLGLACYRLQHFRFEDWSRFQELAKRALAITNSVPS